MIKTIIIYVTNYLCCSLAVDKTSELKRVTRIVEAIVCDQQHYYLGDINLAQSKFQGVCGQVIVTELRVVLLN